MAVLIVVGLTATLSLTHGQEQSVPPPVGQKAAPPSPQRPARDLSKLAPFDRQVLLSAQRGSEWLQRANGGDGRFVPGYVPALRVTLEGDNYLRQAGAALAMAKAAKYFSDDQAAAIARQAILTLLEDTAPEDPKKPDIRVCTLPSGMVNRLGAAAALVQAIGELPAPAGDVLDKAGQLAVYIHRAQGADGGLICSAGGSKTPDDDNEAVTLYSGEALAALMLSHLQRPAPWKLEVVRKALPYYQARWRTQKSPGMVHGHTAAYTEAYLQTNDRAFADFVFEMNDWLCKLQYQEPDPRHPLWEGGFMGCADGKPLAAAPTIASAAWAECLVEACRAARQAGDVARWERYQAALQRCLRFAMTLQYTEANSQHFSEWYRPMILGGFHASHSDGNIRLECTQLPVCAMIGYLQHVARAP
jgi:hypothetical protein